SPVKRDDARQIRIAFQERRQRRINPPEHLRFRPMLLDEPQHGKRLYHVAEGTGFEDEDFHHRKTQDVTRKCVSDLRTLPPIPPLLRCTFCVLRFTSQRPAGRPAAAGGPPRESSSGPSG